MRRVDRERTVFQCLFDGDSHVRSSPVCSDRFLAGLGFGWMPSHGGRRFHRDLFGLCLTSCVNFSKGMPANWGVVL